MSETARYLAVGATNLMHTIDPDIVLFGGGMIAAGTPFLDEIRAEIRRIAFPVPAAQTRVEYAELGGDAGFIGAAGCAGWRSACRPLCCCRSDFNRREFHAGGRDCSSDNLLE